MYCCFHNNVNTPSAKCYGNIIHCFSCNRNYGTYDLLKKYDPKRIDELKQSVVMGQVTTKELKTFKVKSIDRSGTLEDALRAALSD